MISSRLRAAALALLLVVLTSAPGRAQETGAFHINLGIFADVKRFSGDPVEDRLSGEAIGGSAAVGVGVSDRVELSIEVNIPGATEAVETHSVVLRSARVDVQSIARNRPLSVAALARFAPRTDRRLRIGYVAGLSFIGLRQHFAIVAPPEVPASLVPPASTVVEYSAAPTAGVDALWPLSRRLAIVPVFRATVFRGREESGLLLRPGVSARWTF